MEVSSFNTADDDIVVVDVYGDFAAFTRPETRYERATYPIITPSAARGVLCAIYLKPTEFYYEILRIDVIKPGHEISVQRNERNTVAELKYDKKKEKYTVTGIGREKHQIQRVTTYLTDVYYRIYARIVRRPDALERINMQSLMRQFKNRISSGKCFHQPYLGTRECMCCFDEPNYEMVPDETFTADFGPMLYDVFDLTCNEPLYTEGQKIKSGYTNVAFFDAKVDKGVMLVPPFFSDEIYRQKEPRRIETC